MGEGEEEVGGKRGGEERGRGGKGRKKKENIK